MLNFEKIRAFRSGAAALAITALLAGAPAAWGQAGKVSPDVGKPLEAGLAAAKEGRFQDAIANIKKADGVSGKTAFDQLQINEAYCSVYARQRNFNAALAACERSLSQLSGGERNQRLKTLAQIAFQTKPRDLRKTVDYANQYLKATGGSDASMHFLMGQAYYLGGNYKGAVAAMQNAAKIGERSGKPPEENLLRYLLDSYTRLKDEDGVARTTTQLVRHYPSPENWRRLTTGVRRAAVGNDQVTLHVYRLMYELDVMNQADTFSDAAIVAMQAGAPAEALRYMERGVESEAFEKLNDSGKSRNQRIVAQARQQAGQREQRLSAAVETAEQHPQGEALVRVGEAYLDFGQAERAVDFIQRGIDKGGVANADEAWMLLGEAHVRAGNAAEARKAFANVESDDYRPIARLWTIYASQI